MRLFSFGKLCELFLLFLFFIVYRNGKREEVEKEGEEKMHSL